MKVFFLGAGTPHLQNWLNAFVSAGLDVVLLTMHRDSHFKPAFRCIDLSNRIRGKLFYLSALPSIRSALITEQPDLLVSYYASSYGFLARLSGFTPRVVVAAGSDINVTSFGQAPKRLLARAALVGARSVVCWSPTMRSELLELGAAAENIFMLPRGIPLDAIPPRTATGPELVVACTRRFSRHFHHDVLLRACRIAKDRGKRIVLELCGSGPEEIGMRRLATEAGLDEIVRFHGDLPYHQVMCLLARSHVAVSLADTDGASASLFEAMAAGCYPVASDIPANRAWIEHGQNGSLVPHDDPHRVADILIELAANRDKLHEVCRANRQFAEQNLDIRVNTKKYVQHFSDLVGDSQTAFR